MIQSFGEYATDDAIIRLLAKERGKFAVKNSRRKESDNPVYLALKEMLPPRNLWPHPGKVRRPVLSEEQGPATKTHEKRRAAHHAYIAICKLRREQPDAPWARELDRFLRHMHEIVEGRAELKLESPTIVPMFKEQDPDTGDFIFRPICVYHELETKILLALAFRYVQATFDDCFHRNMLFMRAARRKWDGQGWAAPTNLDAIRLVNAYRLKHQEEMIFVGECDIQKFYDIFNHDDILQCFRELYQLKARRLGISESIFEPFDRVLRAYLDSFDYYKHVMLLNDQDNPIWRHEKNKRRSKKCPDPVCRFKWVSDDKFIDAGCYTPDELKAAKESGQLGIPQGGALSGIIVNVVMQSIDKEIIRGKDPGRLFVRYCDDILLMHTDKDKCEAYLDYYDKALRSHKLVPHPLHSVREFKNGSRTLQPYWKAKSKRTFKWGDGAGDAADWIAFVGYEMRRTGEIRFRKDKIDKEFKHIARAYFQSCYSKAEEPADRLDALREVSSRFFQHQTMITPDRYTVAQARHLDKYLVNKFYRAARLHNVEVSAREDLERFSDLLGK